MSFFGIALDSIYDKVKCEYIKVKNWINE
jgi:hypothetical protein